MFERTPYDDYPEGFGEDPGPTALETSHRVPNATTKKDLRGEVRRGSLKEIVRKYRTEGKAVGVQVSNVPGIVRLFVAEHKSLIAAGTAAATGAIVVYEAYKRVKNNVLQ